MFFSLRKEKNEKKPQAYRLTVCAAGSGSVAAMKDGVHAHFVRVIRGPPPFSSISHRKALTRRAPCACGRGVSSRSYFPHGVFRRGLRTLCGAQTRVGSRVYMLPSRSMRVRDESLGKSFGTFLFTEKSTYHLKKFLIFDFPPIFSDILLKNHGKRDIIYHI